MSDNEVAASVETLSDQAQGPTREQTQKTLMDKYPGHISWATDRANFSGCRMIEFRNHDVVGLERADAERFIAEIQSARDPERAFPLEAVEVMNLYFSTRANLLIIDLNVTVTGIVCLITTQLDDEDLQMMEDVRQLNQVAMREIQIKRDAAREARRAQEKEDKRLLAWAKQAEAHNLAGRLRELEQENAQLRKAAGG